MSDQKPSGMRGWSRGAVLTVAVVTAVATAAIAEANCRRCHEPVVQAMGTPAHNGSRDISCIRCHGSVGHMQLAATSVAEPSR